MPTSTVTYLTSFNNFMALFFVTFYLVICLSFFLNGFFKMFSYDYEDGIRINFKQKK